MTQRPVGGQAFFLTHQLYVVLYGLMMVHAGRFWKYLVLPVCLWSAELMLRLVYSPRRSAVAEVTLLPSNVSRPAGVRASGGEIGGARRSRNYASPCYVTRPLGHCRTGPVSLQRETSVYIGSCAVNS